MKNKQQLTLLARERARRERQAAARATAAKSAASRQRQQLQELEAWQADYRHRGPTRGEPVTVSAAELTRWRQFMLGMDSIISRQRETMAQSEAGLAESIDEWRQALLDVEVIDKLRIRLETQKRELESQHEQEDQDDQAGHRYGGWQDR